MSFFDLFKMDDRKPFVVPIKDCKNCTYFRPSDRLYGYCHKHGTDLVINQAPLCPYYMAFGQVTSQIDASHIVSGVIDLSRIPRVDLTKIPLGNDGYFLKGQEASDPVYALLASGDIPNLSASKITSGIFSTARIPNLSASKITSGTFDLARIPVLSDAKIPDLETLSYGGAFAVGQIPSLPASIITSGVFDEARIPHTWANQHVFTKSTYQLKFQIGAYPTLYWCCNPAGNYLFLLEYDGLNKFMVNLDGKITEGNADASFITSGTLGEARIPHRMLNICGGYQVLDPSTTVTASQVYLPANDTLKLWILNRYLQADCYVRIYNMTDSALLDEHSNNAHEEGSPIHSWSYGSAKEILFLYRNDNASFSRAVSANWLITIE